MSKENFLTKREVEVLESILDQNTNRESIGNDLHISPETVRNHLSNIYKKLNIETENDVGGKMTPALVKAIRLRIIDPPGPSIDIKTTEIYRMGLNSPNRN